MDSTRQKMVQFACTDVRSTQDWTIDPEMVLVNITESVIERAKSAWEILKSRGSGYITDLYLLDYETYQSKEEWAAGLTDEDAEPVDTYTDQQGREWVHFKPEYALGFGNMRVDDMGRVFCDIPFRHADDRMRCELGTVKELVALWNQHRRHKVEALIKEAGEICERLVDSEEHAGDGAIPDVAEDAAEMIGKLTDLLRDLAGLPGEDGGVRGEECEECCA